MEISELQSKPLHELRKMGEELGVPNARMRKKEFLMIAINSRTSVEEGVEKGGGILEIMPEGIGFLRENYQMSKNDIYVSQAQLRDSTFATAIWFSGKSAPRANPNAIMG